ncbi:hypothetical protein EV424DRAFT_469601 [Suillus variegatus]|nr:hypothetical protein EV424DRAFT_469601 [Suillus variegatus]
MTIVSNDPSYWPYVNANFFFSYWNVAAGVVVLYDWVLTIGQEIELIWRQRWSLMTVLYLIIRYIGIPYSVVNSLRMSRMRCVPLSDLRDTENMPLVWLTDAVSAITYYARNGTNAALTAMLGVIMIARLHAMYQGSRTMLMFLVIIFLAVNIACAVIAAIGLNNTVAEELILSGICMCSYGYDRDQQPLFSMTWILNTVWEVLALSLSVWVAVKQIRELRRLRPSTGSTIGDCFRVLIQSHVLYFAR